MIRLDLELYPLEVIKVAAEEYSSIANVSFTEEDGFCKCSFSECRYGEALTEKEFCNYLIDLINSTGRIK